MRVLLWLAIVANEESTKRVWVQNERAREPFIWKGRLNNCSFPANQSRMGWTLIGPLQKVDKGHLNVAGVTAALCRSPVHHALRVTYQCREVSEKLIRERGVIKITPGSGGTNSVTVKSREQDHIDWHSYFRNKNYENNFLSDAFLITQIRQEKLTSWEIRLFIRPIRSECWIQYVDFRWSWLQQQEGAPASCP